MRLDRLTNKFQLALADAQSLALGRDNQFIEPIHLMSAMLGQDGARFVLCWYLQALISVSFSSPRSRLLPAYRRWRGPVAMFSHPTT